MLLAARAHGLQAIDGPYLGVAVDDAFTAAAARGARPRLRRQVGDPPVARSAALNDAFTPTEDEVERARAVLAALDAAERGRRGRRRARRADARRGGARRPRGARSRAPARRRDGRVRDGARRRARTSTTSRVGAASTRRARADADRRPRRAAPGDRRRPAAARARRDAGARVVPARARRSRIRRSSGTSRSASRRCVTQRVIANLFYRGLVLRRAPLIGDTLRTTTEVVALRAEQRARRTAPPTGLAVLRIAHRRPGGAPGARLLALRDAAAARPARRAPATPTTSTRSAARARRRRRSRRRVAGWDLAAFRAARPGAAPRRPRRRHAPGRSRAATS